MSRDDAREPRIASTPRTLLVGGAAAIPGVSGSFHSSLACAALLLAASSLGAHADEIDEYLAAEARRNHIPALSVAIVLDGAVQKIQSYGVANLEWNAAATNDTAYQLASATKPFTGLVLMRLVEQGRLSLEDGLERFFPEAPSAWAKIRVRDLAAHTSGLKEVAAENLDTVDAIVAAAMAQPLDGEPRERSRYGLTDFVVLTAVLERAGGKPFATLLRDLVTAPLGLASTAFNNQTQAGPVRAADPLPRRATTYRWEDGGQRIFEFLYAIPAYSAGGLHSSSEDLARLLLALEGGRLLRPESLTAMWTPPRLRSGDAGEFGLGWVVKTHRGQKAVGHSGGPALADILYFPEKRLGIAVLVNQQRMYPYLAEGVADSFLAAPAVAPIADREPALTARLRAVLARAASGDVDTEAIAGGEQSELARMLREMGPTVLGVFEPIRGMDLVDERQEHGKWVRKYRVLFGRTDRYWLFELASDGKIVSMRPSAE